jgi:hypothetical protein
VGNLNEVVYFRTVANRRGTEFSPVNTTSRSNLDAVPNLDGADLWNLDQASTIG